MVKNKIKDKVKISKNSRLKQKFPIVRICLKANANNSLVVLTDLEGKIISWCTSGKAGFKGAKKATPFAAQKVTEEIVEKAKIVEATSAHIIINGGGMGRDSFLRAIQSSGIQVESICDTTGFPHGGPKKTNRRRV
jgi:small subunit ribosomal protein S11